VDTEKTVALARDPFSQSLPGELLRLLLIVTASCSAMASAAQSAVDPGGWMLVVGNLLVLASVVTVYWEGAVRGALLACLACAVTYAILQSGGSNRWWAPVLLFSPAALVVSLAILIVRDCMIALPAIALPALVRRASLRAVMVGLGVVAVLVYMVVVPSLAALLESFKERPASYVMEELSVYDQLRIRSAKFAVFAIFTYIGACVASFINVVAASAPRGGAIALRSSACPLCGVPIRRVDNLPIFSYLNLAGRCRNCSAVIPVRYFIVELLGAVIFGALFLFELVTGAANVPGFQHYHYTGIVWIILYTKWPVVGIYLYHVGLFSCLMMLALMDLDRLKCPRWLSGAMLAFFAGLAIAVPTLQPVKFYSQLPIDFTGALPVWAISVATCWIGGMAGWLVTIVLLRCMRHRALRRFAGHQFPLAGSLLGIALGWQAAVTIAVWLAGATLALWWLGWLRTRPLRYSATAVLATLAFLHQPAWKWLAHFW
jgi:leader peptidase (prepilin peptidase) / N-methyltransferase